MVDYLTYRLTPHGEMINEETLEQISEVVSEQVDIHNSYWAEHNSSLMEGYSDACNLTEQEFQNLTYNMNVPGQIAIGDAWPISRTLIGIPIGLMDMILEGIKDVYETHNLYMLIGTPLHILIEGIKDAALHIGEQGYGWFVEGSLIGKSPYQISNEVVGTLLAAGLMIMGGRGVIKGGGNMMNNAGAVLADVVKDKGPRLAPALVGENISVGGGAFAKTGPFKPVLPDLINGISLIKSEDLDFDQKCGAKNHGKGSSVGSKQKVSLHVNKKGIFAEVEGERYSAEIHDDYVFSFRKDNKKHFVDINGNYITGNSKKIAIIKHEGKISDLVVDGETVKNWNVVDDGVIQVQLGAKTVYYDASGQLLYGDSKCPLVIKQNGKIKHVHMDGADRSFRLFDDDTFGIKIDGESYVFDSNGTIIEIPSGMNALIKLREGIHYVFYDSKLRPVEGMYKNMLKFLYDGKTRYVDMNGRMIGTIDDPVLIRKSKNEVMKIIEGRSYGEINLRSSYVIRKTDAEIAIYHPDGSQLDLSNKTPLYFEKRDGSPIIFFKNELHNVFYGEGKRVYIIDGREAIAFEVQRDGLGLGDFLKDPLRNTWTHQISKDFLVTHDGQISGCTVKGIFFEKVAEDGSVVFFKEGDSIIAMDVNTRKGIEFGTKRGRKSGGINFGKNRIITGSDNYPSIIIHEGEAYGVLSYSVSEGLLYAKNVRGGLKPVTGDGLHLFKLNNDGIKMVPKSEIQKRFIDVVRDPKSQKFTLSSLERPIDVKATRIRTYERMVEFADETVGVEYHEYKVEIVAKNRRRKKIIVRIPKDINVNLTDFRNGEPNAMGFVGSATLRNMGLPTLDSIISSLKKIPFTMIERCESIMLEPYSKSILKYQEDSGNTMASYRYTNSIDIYHVKTQFNKGSGLKDMLTHELGHGVDNIYSRNKSAILNAVILDGNRATKFMRLKRGDYYFAINSAEYFSETVCEYLRNRELFRRNAPHMAEFIEFKLAQLKRMGVDVSNPGVAAFALVLYVLGEKLEDNQEDNL